jgi:3-methyl-2-oxobutanoate hydroxymethyltransferase
VHRFGYRRQANDPISQQRLRCSALDLQAAGCFALVLEHVPADLASSLSAELTLPVIGIGAGDQCDGQVRVTADLLGLTERQPPFSPPLLPGRQLCVAALRGWVDALQDPAAAAPTTAAAPAAPHC